MKKIILIFLMFILCGCSLFNKGDINDLIFDKTSSSKPEESKPEYQDDNPVKISLYVDNAFGGLDKVEEEFKETWQLKRDIVVFGSIFSDEERLESDYFQNLWKNNAQQYDEYIKYKTGWYVNFKLNDGTEIDQMIYGPEDVSYFYDYLEIYLYDSANQPIGTWYSHLTEKDITDNTIMTSMKLTAGSKFMEIEGPITVSVFTYDSEDDFDETGKYRGNSVSTTKVYND